MADFRKYLFIFLNAVRVLSIVSLILLFSSSIVTIVDDVKAVNAFMSAGRSGSSSTANSTAIDCSVYDCDYIEGSTVPNQPAGAFWAVLNRLLVIFQSIVCIMSEVGWPAKFFDVFFPVLSRSFGLGALGVIQCLLGAAVLSHHVDEFALVTAFLVFSIGCLNMFLGLVFRESAKEKRSIRAWRNRGGADELPQVAPTATYPRSNYFSNYMDEKKGADAWRSGSLSSQKAGMGFGRQAEKFAASQGYVVRHPDEAVPPYVAKSSPRSSRGSDSDYSESRPASVHEHVPERVKSPSTSSSATAV